MKEKPKTVHSTVDKTMIIFISVLLLVVFTIMFTLIRSSVARQSACEELGGVYFDRVHKCVKKDSIIELEKR